MEKRYVVGIAGSACGWAVFDSTQRGLLISASRREGATALRRSLAQCVAALVSYAYPGERVIIEEAS